jgi:DNA-binding CsgD family transcriptional regulator
MDTAKQPNNAYQAMLADSAKRHAEAKRMFMAGKSTTEIAAHFGISRQRAHQMVTKKEAKA